MFPSKNAQVLEELRQDYKEMLEEVRKLRKELEGFMELHWRFSVE